MPPAGCDREFADLGLTPGGLSGIILWVENPKKIIPMVFNASGDRPTTGATSACGATKAVTPRDNLSVGQVLKVKIPNVRGLMVGSLQFEFQHLIKVTIKQTPIPGN
jgi:hypothetical protein